MRPFLFSYTAPPTHKNQRLLFSDQLLKISDKLSSQCDFVIIHIKYLFRDEVNNLFLREIAPKLPCHVSHWILSCFFIRKPYTITLHVVFEVLKGKSIWSFSNKNIVTVKVYVRNNSGIKNVWMSDQESFQFSRSHLFIQQKPQGLWVLKSYTIDQYVTKIGLYIT